MAGLIVALVIVVLGILIGLGRSFKIVQQYEKGIVYRFG